MRKSEDMDEALRLALSFEGQAHLLRASRLSSVLHCGAKIFANPVGSAETYALSQKVTAIDAFLSHNWAVLRRDKFLCLALHFSFRSAVIAALVACALTAAASKLGARVFVSQYPLSADASKGTIEHGWGCTLVMAPVFLAAACFGHELQWMAGRGCRVFLDKTCINQVDKTLMRAGISKLGAFIRQSSRMVVCYTDLYLMKLWTVYEVACFLSLHPSRHLIIIPTFQPKLVFGGTAIVYTAEVIRLLLGSQSSLFLPVTVVAILMTASIFALVLRRWAREKEAIRKRVVGFEVTECLCACEEDRPLVNQNIALLMRANGEVPSDASERDALTAFNGLVRRRIPDALLASIGPIGMTYSQVVGIFICTNLPLAVDVSLLGDFPHPEEEWIARRRVCGVAYNAARVFGLFPLAAALLSLWCGTCLHLTGCWELVHLGVGTLLFLVLFVIPLHTTGLLLEAAVFGGDHRDLNTIGLATWVVGLALIAKSVYTQGRWFGGQGGPGEAEAEEGAKAGRTGHEEAPWGPAAAGQRAEVQEGEEAHSGGVAIVLGHPLDAELPEAEEVLEDEEENSVLSSV